MCKKMIAHNSFTAEAALTFFQGLVCFIPAVPVYANDLWQPLPTGTVQRIAFGSCAKQWQHQTIWNAILWEFEGQYIYYRMIYTDLPVTHA